MALQLSEDAVARLTVRCALDSMPRTRRKVLGALAAADDGMNVSALSRATGGTDRKVLKRTAEDLRAVGLTVCPVLEQYDADDESDAGLVARDWRLSDRRLGRLARSVLAAQAEREGCSESDS